MSSSYYLLVPVGPVLPESSKETSAIRIAVDSVINHHKSINKAAKEFNVPRATLQRAVKKATHKPSAKASSQPVRRKSTPQVLEEATSAVKNGLSLYKASRDFHVDYRVLRRHLENPDVKMGRQLKFSVELENDVLNLLVNCQKIGVPLNKKRLNNVIAAVGKVHGIHDAKAFTNRWYHSCLQRHQTKLSQRVAVAGSKGMPRAWNVEKCESWISVLNDLQKSGYLGDPSGLWHLDESIFRVDKIYDKMYGAEGAKEVVSVFAGDDKERLSVLASGDATGNILKPLILYEGKTLLLSQVDGTDRSCYFRVSTSGWSDTDIFTEYVRKELIPNMKAEKNVLFFDGHWSHLYDMGLINLCANSGRDIKIVCFPAGQTGRLLPLDKHVFGGMKAQWRSHLRELKTRSNFDEIDPIFFPERLISLWSSFNLKATFRHGFLKTGIYPFSPELIRATVREVVVTEPDPFASAEKHLRKQLKTDYKLSPKNTEHILRIAKRLAKGETEHVDASRAVKDAIKDPVPSKSKPRAVKDGDAKDASLSKRKPRAVKDAKVALSQKRNPGEKKTKKRAI